MKGIRKLFLGLFLMTLFGVGFKVEAKAAVTNQTKGTPTATTNVDYYDGTSGNVIEGVFTYSYDNTSGSFPSDNDTYVTYRVRLQTGTADSDDTWIGTPVFICFKTDTEGKHYIGTSTTTAADALAAATTEAATSGSDIPYKATATRTDVTAARKSTSSALEVKLYVSNVAGTATAPAITEGSSTGLTLTKEVTTAKDPTTVTNVSISPISAYLLPGQTQEFVASFTSTPASCKFDSWTFTDTSLSDEGKSSTLPKVYQTIKLKKDATAGGTVTAHYITADLKVTYPAGTISPGDSISPSFLFTGYTAADIYNNEVYVDSESTANKITYTLSSTTANGNITFTVPGLATGSHKLLFKMNDGNVLETGNFTVTNNVTVSEPIMVTKGLTVPLSNYTTSTSSYISSASNVGTYISVLGTIPGSASTIKVRGVNTTDNTEKEGIEVNETKYKVLVYDSPTIKTKASSTSKLFSVKMPKAVYHDSVAWSDYDSFAIYYNNSAHRVYDIEEKDKAADYVDVKQFTKDVNEAIDGDDEKTISIIAYPVKGDTVDKGAPSNEIKKKVYRIKLDGDGGANYKVNGKEMENYFYAIEGFDYKIDATPKSGYTTPLEKWEGVSFGTSASGTTDFDEHKTIKAYFKNNSSTSQSSSIPSTSGRNAATAGEGTDDYDDVPKTGESKADIWILWSVLFVSILGAGFMIWKRFGLVRAIAEADEEVAVAEHKEEVKAKKKEKEDKIKMLKDLRNL